ncbi:MAG: DUF3368 domain-containing protein [bacterium]
MIIVSNSTPIIAFSRINQMELLQVIVGKLLIPAEVANELSEYGKGKNKSLDLNQHKWITVQEIQDKSKMRLLLPSLDRGEAEVIELAIETKTDLVLIDELTGRKVAESLDLNIIGSAGILIKAKDLGKIQAVKPYMDEMVDKGIRYSERFYKSLLHQIGEL